MSATEPTRVATAADRTVLVMNKGMADPAQPAPRQHGPFVPLLLATLALIATFGWQTAGLFAERQALLAGHAGQQQTVDNAGTLRASLDGLAADTQRLAEAGNASAALLVTELKKRGITINPNATSPATPPR